MRILVLGAGGIGGWVAHALIKSGKSVTVGVRSARTSDVLSVRSHHGRCSEIVAQYDNLWSVAGYDIIILAVRPVHLESVLQRMGRLNGKQTVVVCQNGLCEPTVRAAIGAEATIIGAVITWAAGREGSTIVFNAEGRTTLGAFGQCSEGRKELVCSLFSSVSAVSWTENLLGVRWSKLALNCAASTLCVLVDGSLGKALFKPSAISVGIRLVEEVCAVAVTNGVTMEPIMGTVDLVKRFGPNSRTRVQRLLNRFMLCLLALRYARLKSSLYRAMNLGEPSGIEWLCGVVVEQARSVKVPVNEAVLTVIRKHEEDPQSMLNALLSQVTMTLNNQPGC